MLAKKESFLKYLKDDDPPYPKKKEIKENNDNEQKNIDNSKNESKKNDYSFENFVNHIKNFDFNKKIKWDSEIHKTSITKEKNLYTVKLMELSSFNFANPILILNKEYLKSTYDPILFEQEINHIEDKIKINQYNNKEIIENPNILIDNLIEEREKYELNKKIINYYLLYYCENSFEEIAPHISKINQITTDIELFYDKINKGKIKIHNLKKYNIDNTMKIIIKKKKHENLLKLYFFLKEKIFTIYKDIKNLKLKSMNFDYINYYNMNNQLMNNIDLLEKNIEQVFNKNNNKSLLMIEAIKKKLIKKKEKIIYKYTKELNNLFDSKKSNIIQLYNLFNLENNIKILNENNSNDKILNNQSNLFISKMVKNFKIQSKKLILETVHFFRKKEKQRSNSITILNLNNQKLSSINSIHIEENDLIICFKTILLKLKNHADIFIYYFNLICSKEKDSNEYKFLAKEIKSRKNDFYEILDKHLSKLVKLFYNSNDKQNEEKVISKNNFLIILNLICLFSKLLKFKFEVDYSKYLNLALKNYIVNQIKFENKSNLSKAIAILPNDLWEKTLLDSSFFQINSIKEKTPFYLKKFIVYLNEDEIEDHSIFNEINKNNIEDIFNYINNNYNINDNSNDNNINFDEVVDLYNSKKGIKLIQKKNNINILNKPLKYNSLYVTNSSTCILKGVEDQIINLIMFDYLTYEIFNYLFNTIDLYIFVCFKAFMINNKYIYSLLKPLNLKEIQKDIENIEYWSEVISYQQKYSELKKFYISTEKKFCDFYGHNKKFSSDEEKQNFIDNLIPKLNENILDSNQKEIKLQSNDTTNQSNLKNNFKLLKINKNDKDILDTTLNINQINKNNTKNVVKEKNFSFLDKLKSAVDDIGDGISKAKNSAKNILKDSQKQNSPIIKEIREKIKVTHIKQIIIFISTISTIYKTLKRLTGFTSKIELDFQRNQIIDKLNKYKNLKEQIQYFFFMKISLNFMDFPKISPLIEEFNWTPSSEEGSTQLFEASSWVTKIIKLFELITNEIIVQFNELFGEKKLIEYFVILIKFIISNIQENFAKIRKCNDTGRSIMLKDIKFLKQGIENILKKYNFIKKIKIDDLFDIIFQYVNAWYYNKEELVKFLFDNNIQYKYFKSFIYTSPILTELSSEIKIDLINRVRQKYLIQFKKVIMSLKD